jgi:hypothetical protein
MNNEIIFTVMAIFGAIFSGLQLYQIKRIADLCERVTRLETEIEHHFNGKHEENKGRRFA